MIDFHPRHRLGSRSFFLDHFYIEYPDAEEWGGKKPRNFGFFLKNHELDLEGHHNVQKVLDFCFDEWVASRIGSLLVRHHPENIRPATKTSFRYKFPVLDEPSKTVDKISGFRQYPHEIKLERLDLGGISTCSLAFDDPSGAAIYEWQEFFREKTFEGLIFSGRYNLKIEHLERFYIIETPKIIKSCEMMIRG